MSEQLSLTDRATARISYIIKKEKKDNAVFRISVSGGGCSGFQYTFAVEDSYSKDDTILKKEGLIIAIDPSSMNFLKNSEIDYIDDLIGSSFKVKNPKATSSCGCGMSFSI
tara:strand:- start:3 stop:335 length:333 start_codon:yes stop_codon:yes gene_type:complete